MHHITINAQEKRALYLWVGVSCMSIIVILITLAYLSHAQQATITALQARQTSPDVVEQRQKQHKKYTKLRTAQKQYQTFVQALELISTIIPNDARIVRYMYTYQRPISIECELGDRSGFYRFLDRLKNTYAAALRSIKGTPNQSQAEVLINHEDVV
jgi:hypothetical protein